MKNISRNRVPNFSTKRFQNISQKLVNVYIVEKFIRTSLYFKAYNTSKNRYWYSVYVKLCKSINTNKIIPPKLPNCYIFIEKLTVPAIFSYKSINYKDYIEQKKEKLELLEKKNNKKILLKNDRNRIKSDTLSAT
jgi:hypothetical protein